MRTAASVVSFVMAGFFVYLVTLLTYLTQPQDISKVYWLGGFSVPGAIFFLLGVWAKKSPGWKFAAGTVLMSGAGVTAFVAFTVACLLLSEEFRAMMPADTLEQFRGYPAGIAVTLIVFAIGFVLLRRAKRSGDTNA